MSLKINAICDFTDNAHISEAVRDSPLAPPKSVDCVLRALVGSPGAVPGRRAAEPIRPSLGTARASTVHAPSLACTVRPPQHGPPDQTGLPAIRAADSRDWTDPGPADRSEFGAHSRRSAHLATGGEQLRHTAVGTTSGNRADTGQLRHHYLATSAVPRRFLETPT